jgi:ribose 5-phosphate isomerase A
MPFHTPEALHKMKLAAAEMAAQLIQPGMHVGLGTGSTARLFLEALRRRVKEGLKLRGLASSLETEKLAREFGIPLLSPETTVELDIAVDGADAVDPNGTLLKGGGGALLREKIMASMARNYVVIVDETKWQPSLRGLPLPVEISSFGAAATLQRLHEIGCLPVLRGVLTPFITDNGHWIADCRLPSVIEDASTYVNEIERIPGVMATGYFVGMTSLILVGTSNGSVTEHVF